MIDKMPSVTGLRIKKFYSTEGKSEDDPGKLQITLEADKDSIEVFASDLDLSLTDIMGALTIHQTAKEPVFLKLRFPNS